MRNQPTHNQSPERQRRVEHQSPEREKNSRKDTMISPLVLCLPPTSVGGQRSKSSLLEPASAGLLEEPGSPAEAGSIVICTSPTHQLKLVANRNIFLRVPRFARYLRQRRAEQIRNFAVLSCATIALCGCQQPQGELFPAINPPIVWPAKPETPRMRLVGAISDSTDLKSGRSGAEVLGAAFRGPRPPIRFSGPHAVAYHPADLLAVADSSGGAVHIIDLQERAHVVSYGTEQQRFAAPVGITWADDQLFVSDAQLHQIIQLDQTGRVIRHFGEAELLRPVGITYVPQRREFYVVDGGAHVIVVFDRTGQSVRTLGGRGTQPGEFNYPTHIAFDGTARLAIADTGNFRVQVLDLDGKCRRVLGQKGDAAGDFALPKGVAFDSQGHLYVVDAQFENFQIFDDEGRLLLAVGREGSAPGQFALPAGLTVDTHDRVWVADAANRRIQVFQYLKEGMSPQLSAISQRMEN